MKITQEQHDEISAAYARRLRAEQSKLAIESLASASEALATATGLLVAEADEAAIDDTLAELEYSLLALAGAVQMLRMKRAEVL